MKKNAWVCDTAYQLLNAINYVWDHRNDTNVLFVGLQFHNAESIVEKLKEEGIFSNIYCYYTRSQLGKPKSVIEQGLEILFPSVRLSKMLVKEEGAKNERYDTIYMSMPTHFSAALVYHTKCKHVVYFDDGIGSYTGDISQLVSKTSIVHYLLGKSPRKLQPERMLLNNAAFCQHPFTTIEELPRITRDNSLLSSLEKVFSYQNDNYYQDRKMIYLSQPLGEINEDAKEYEAKILKQLQREADPILMRLHPRELSKKLEGFEIDSHRDMWELACANQITDDHTLISTYSTSQLIPKMLYDKEPTLVFLYKLYPFLKNNVDMAKMIELVKKEYRDQSKIIVIEDMDTYSEFIKTF